ncbi:MAG: SPASM domain-containing protein [Nanoarchaeota archaeon]|nr:SPASM domain-containing protein [Nanoarchaeota archaeon]MBU1269264.1 SPASM domain-containing protein [Nanoarchaeota archaeon]MBU1604207.1 SPASM domain-containing protein [Nanoarchaeota archaeon]MBU2442629.1 SPASM domain-containing protein [Nanoarchaeota archaeon]
MTPRKSEELLSSKIDQVIFSFNGSTKEEYEFFMKPLKFDDVVGRISDFIKMRGNRKTPQIAVHMLKLGASKDSLIRMRNYWNKLGVTVHILKYENRAGNVKNYDVKLTKNVKKIPCYRLLNHMYIVVNGDAVLCCADWEREVVIGNLRKQSISNVWNGKVRAEYVKAHKEGRFDELKLCDVCNFNEIVVD